MPGSPSCLRPRKPPRRAIIRTAARVLGGWAGGVALQWVWHQSACHSGSESHWLAGAVALPGPASGAAQREDARAGALSAVEWGDDDVEHQAAPA